MDDIVYDIGSEPTGTVATSGRPDTRARILDAARDLILEQHPAALTIAEIAAAAGVSHRTVYRYFPTKEELITAVAEWPTERMPELSMPESWDEARGALRVYWQLFGQNLDTLRGERLIPGGLELRRARLASARVAMDAVLDDAGVPHDEERDGLREIIIHLTSSTTLLELVDRHGMTVAAATDLAIDTADRLVRSAAD